MSWFSRIEEACTGFIERAFGNMFPSDLEPAQIARKLVAVMESRTRSGESALVAPSRYDVSVNPADYDRLSAHRTYLEREWAALLRDVAARVGIRFETASGAPVVTLNKDESMLPGAIDVAVPEAQPRADRFLLRLVDGLPAGAEYTVAARSRVGRSRDNEIFIADPSVSRKHAVLEVLDERLVVRDSGSTNGTFVNGERVQVRTLQPGDVVAFGKTQLRVEAAP